MASKPKIEKRLLFIDPHDQPVRVIYQVSFHSTKGGLLDLTLCTLVEIADGEGTSHREAVVAARLRFSLDMAKALRDGLARQIAQAESTVPRLN